MYTRSGPIMAGADSFSVEIKGKGGHAAYPHEVKDPIVAALSLPKPFRPLLAEITYPAMIW